MSLAASPPLVIVLTTLPSEDDAVALVRALLDRRLVACGTILPGARSVYRWEGAVEDAREAVVLLKTLEDQVEALRAAFAWTPGEWVERAGHGTLWQDGYWRKDGPSYAWVPAHWM